MARPDAWSDQTRPGKLLHHSARGTTPRKPGTDRHPSQPSIISSPTGVMSGFTSTVGGTGGDGRSPGR